VPHQNSTRLITWTPTSWWIICFTFYILFCKGLKMMGSNKICKVSCTCMHVLSLFYLCHLPFTWIIMNENYQKILFLCNSFHNFTLKRNELRYHCCLSQLFFIGQVLWSLYQIAINLSQTDSWEPVLHSIGYAVH
jgi:hypothetical protein